MQTVQAPLPAVISVTEDTNTPRRPTLKDALMAKKKPIHLWQLEPDLDLSKGGLAQKGLLERVHTEGIVIDRKQQLLQGDDPAGLANQLVDLLLADNLIKGGA
jgi:electron transfer flavoprotein beta subunit